MENWIEICRLDRIPRHGARVVCTGRGAVAVFRTGEDRVFALEDRCPHRDGPLSQGILHGDRVTCPMHDWTIELATGVAVAPDQGSTPTVPVRIERGMVLLDLAPAEAEPVATGAP